MIKVLLLPYFVVCIPLAVLFIILFFISVVCLYPIVVFFEVYEKGHAISWDNYITELADIARGR